MTSRPQTLGMDNYSTSAAAQFAAIPSNPQDTSPVSQSLSAQQYPDSKFHEDFAASQRGSSIIDGPSPRRNDSTMSTSNPVTSPSRGGTLKKKASLSRNNSLRRTSSRRSSHAGSVRSMALGDKEKYGEGDEENSAFFTPVPTSGNPTEILVNRFQAWRKILKDLITYFREIQVSYEQRSKSLLKVSNVINNMTMPSMFLKSGGIDEANTILKNYHKQALADGAKAKELESNVILQLTGLRSDLNQKIKEIKSLSGDFKNSVEKEMDITKKAVRGLQEALGLVDTEPGAVAGKGDPFIIKLGVDRQVERQIDEENYLHRAYLNLEGSGRELESIVVGEIQKAYNVYAGLLTKEADEAYETVEKLKSGPIAMPKDQEWSRFVESDKQFINPKLPVRSVEDITYPGKHDPAAAEVRSGMLERKSKYLKSYTAGWYVLSPTHLHEFKSADRLSSQAPVMSLLLPEQKLGSHAQPGSTSHKFMVKGRQTGSMHRGHSWVFRAESHETMLAWYEDMRALTEKSGADRDNYVRKHARSISGGSQRASSISSHGSMEEDEADEQPYSATASSVNAAAMVPAAPKPARPSPGGRFPSDLDVGRGLQAQRSGSSGSDHENDYGHGFATSDRSVIAAAGAVPGSEFPTTHHYQHEQYASEPTYGVYVQQSRAVEPSFMPQSQMAPQQPTPAALATSQPHAHYTAPDAAVVAPVVLASHSATQQPANNDPPAHSSGAAPTVVPTTATRSSASTSVSYPAELAAGGSSPAPSASTIQTPPEDTFGSSTQSAAFAAKTAVDGSHDKKQEAEDLTPTLTRTGAAGAEGSYFAAKPRPDLKSMVAGKSASELHMPGEYPATPASQAP